MSRKRDEGEKEQEDIEQKGGRAGEGGAGTRRIRKSRGEAESSGKSGSGILFVHF